MRSNIPDYPAPSDLAADQVVTVHGNDSPRMEIATPAPDYRDLSVWARKIVEGIGNLTPVTPALAFAIGEIVRGHSSAETERLLCDLSEAFDAAFAKLPMIAKAKHGPKWFAKYVDSRLVGVFQVVFTDLTDREGLEKRRRQIYDALSAAPTDREIRRVRNSIDELSIGLEAFLSDYRGNDPLNVGIIAKKNLIEAIHSIRSRARTHPDELLRKSKTTSEETQKEVQSGVGAVLKAPISDLLTTRVSELVRGKVRPTGKRPFGKRS